MRNLVGDVYNIPTLIAHVPKERLALPGVDAACIEGGIEWIIPADGGVVVIDAGFDEDGELLRAHLRGRRVLAILLTHGHPDHRAAAHLFDAPVYVGRGDVPLVEGTYRYRSLVAALDLVLGVAPRPKTLVPVDDRDVLVIGGVQFTAIALPGHTPGSTAWLWRDVLFSGDAAQSVFGDEVHPAPPEVSEDLRRAYDSLRRLRDVPFTTLADGHFGVAHDAKRKVFDAIVRGHDDDEIFASYPKLRPLACSALDTPPP